MARAHKATKLRRMWAMMAPHTKGERPRFLAGALLGIGVLVLHVLQPWPLKWILDYLGGSSRGTTPVEWIAQSPGWGTSLLCLAFVLLALARAGAEYSQVLILNGVGTRVVFRFRAALFGHLLRQPLAFHERKEVGELLTRVVYDTSRLRRGLNALLTQVIQSLALFLATLGVLLWHNLALAAALAGGGVCALVAMRRRGRRIARAAKKQRQKEGSLAALVEQELRSVRELQTFGLSGSALLGKFERRNLQSLDREQKVRKLAAGLTFSVDSMLAVAIAAAVALGINSVGAGQLTAGDLWLFLSYALSLRTPFTAFARQTARLGQTYACAERLVRLAEREPEIKDDPVARVDAVGGHLAFEAVSAKAPKSSRGGRKWTLDQVSFTIPAGKRVAVIGSNGAGKSTLLRMVLRLADPVQGRVVFDGHDIRDYSVEALRRQMSVVFQDSVLPGLSVRENISLGSPDASADSILAAARAADADSFIDRLPEGYDTKVRRGGGLLSGGERQLLAIARAILRDGRIWVLDEPTTGLEHTLASRLVDRLLTLTAGRTTLWVTHDPQLVCRLDSVLLLEHGKVSFNGSPEDYHAWVSQFLSRSIFA